jgi:hypothetical protein
VGDHGFVVVLEGFVVVVEGAVVVVDGIVVVADGAVVVAPGAIVVVEPGAIVVVAPGAVVVVVEVPEIRSCMIEIVCTLGLSTEAPGGTYANVISCPFVNRRLAGSATVAGSVDATPVALAHVTTRTSAFLCASGVPAGQVPPFVKAPFPGSLRVVEVSFNLG